MKRFLVALACAWLALAGSAQQAAAGTPAQAAVVLAGQKSIYPGASVALDFVGQACAGQIRCFKAGGVTTTNFASLPGVTVTRASGGYAEDQTGALTWFNSGQARITNKGLLVEETRTNLVLQSQNFGTTWQVSNATVVSTTAGAAPDGTNTASQLRSVAAGDSYVFQSVTKAASALTYTFSVYAKYVDTAWGVVQVSNGTNGYLYWFNIQTCTAGSANGFGTTPYTSTGYSTAPAANGWCRLIVTFTSDAGTVFTPVYRLASANGTTTIGAAGANALLWGGDLEQATFATSYIPTTTASATRAADSVALSLGLPSAYTWEASGLLNGTQASGLFPNLVAWTNGSISSLFVGVAAGQAGVNVAGGVFNNFLGTPAYSNGQTVRVGASLASNSLVTSTGGISGAGSSSITPPTGAVTAFIGGGGAVGNPWNGYVQAVAFYPTALSQGQLNSWAGGADLSSLNFNFTSGSYRLGAGQATTTCFTCLAGVSVVRGSSGYADDSSGNLVQFAANAPRITDRGLLVEESRSNAALQSQTFDNASWTKRSLYSVTADQATAPDGTLTADLVTNGGSSNTTEGLFFNTTAVGNAQYVFSIYLKAGTATSAILELKDANSDTVRTSSVVSLTSSWQRFNIIATTAGASAGFRAEFGSNGTTGTFYAWGAQVEAGAFPTSYIPTTSAIATRAADAVSVAYSGLPAGTLAVQHLVLSAPNIYRAAAQLDDGTNNNRIEAAVGTGSSQTPRFVISSSGTSYLNVVMPAPNVAPGDVVGQAISWDGTTGRAAGRGVSVAAAASTNPAAVTALHIGSRMNPGSDFLNGYVQQVRIYPYAANDNELQFRSAGNW